jgi:hypothetical protein
MGRVLARVGDWLGGRAVGRGAGKGSRRYLQQIVIDRSKRLTGVIRDVRPEEIFDFSFIRKAQAEVTQSGWTP